MKPRSISLVRLDGAPVSPYRVTIRLCRVEDISDILRLQGLILSHMPDPALFQPTGEGDTRIMFEHGDAIIGCYSNDELIAYGSVVFPGARADNLAYDAGFYESDIPLTATFDTVAVHPAYRGNGLHRHLGTAAEEIALERGMRFLCATVSPENAFSLRNFETLGYRMVATKLKYGGKLRHILVKELA